jgi:type I restriction-modification system DNA methylase subunit
LAASGASFKATLEKLVRRFDADRRHYTSKSYLEAQARVDFITPFFKALGWDVENEGGLPHHAREVVVEAAEDTRGRPDYGFRVGDQTKFFVEAKAPSEELDAAKHIIQAKTYAWNTKQVFLVALTDFEEFRFYDASIQPDTRRPEEGLLLRLKYTEYIDNADKLWEFSKERVASGSLEAMLPRDRRTQRLRIPVDTAFLVEMTGWREDLARNVYKNNPDFTAKQLNEVVQRLLDRIVFIRIAEDRRVIEKHQLRDAVEEWKARGGKFHIFDWLNDLFQRINEDFNGEIFKPHLSEKIKIDSDVLADIIERLYPPKSPYRFDVMGVELLGSIYERYLGNTIRVTAKRIFVEEKPEVRKAGGVYYTPKYIVDYIVQNTVGKVIEGKTPKQIEKIRILDPACGSGSFLIGAFQCLIDYHIRWYMDHPEPESTRKGARLEFMRDVQIDPDGSTRLSVYRKARILRNNLYGVDIDPQAVEITMMSLYLKALEGERSQLPPKQSILPELKYNIVCGNSLVGRDILSQSTLFDDAERNRINAFDWTAEGTGFGSIMKESGGFDCVIANPPYIRIQTLQDVAPAEAAYLKARFESARRGNFDIYVCFVERGFSVLKEGGRLGYILPSKFFQTDYGAGLRRLLVAAKAIEMIVDFGHKQVFDGATTYTCLLFLSRERNQTFRYLRVAENAILLSESSATQFRDSESLTPGPWVLAEEPHRKLFAKMEASSINLLQVPTDISRGSSSGLDDIFIVKNTKRPGRYESREGEPVRLEAGITRAPVHASDFGRYSFMPAMRESIIFPYLIRDGSAGLMSESHLKTEFPLAYNYLRKHRGRLEGRKQFAAWYSYSAPRNLVLHDSARILVPLLADRGLFCGLPEQRDKYCLMASGGFSVTVGQGAPFSSKYLLGLLNSTLLFAYLRSISNIFRGGWITCTKQYVGRLPIRTIDFSDPRQRDQHDSISKKVEEMLSLKAKRSEKLAPSEVARLDREIAATDAEIDDLVFTLYGITKEERRIIEESEPKGSNTDAAAAMPSRRPAAAR